MSDNNENNIFSAPDAAQGPKGEQAAETVTDSTDETLADSTDETATGLTGETAATETGGEASAAQPARNKNSIDMLNGPIMSRLIVFAVPLMLSGILQLLFNAADVVVVGRFAGSDSLAAVGSTGALINLITNLFIGLSVGSNVIMARAIGRGDHEKAGRVVHTSLLVALAGGLIVSAVGLIFSRGMLEAMKSDPEVIDKSALYLRIYFAGAPASMIYNFGAALLRAKGDTRRPLFFLVAAGIINAGLNLIFVICFKMDVAGVALATVISQVVSAALVLRCMLRETDFCKLLIKKLRFHKRELIEIIRLGLPTGLYSSLFSLSNILIQSSINGLGKIAMAGNAAGSNIEGFVYTVMNALGNAATTFTGQNCGACYPKRVKRVFVDSMLLVSLFGFGLGMIMFAAAAPMSHIYSNEADVVAVAVLRLKIIMPTYFLCGMMEVAVGSLRGMGYFVFPTVNSLIMACLFRVVWVYTAFAAATSVAGFAVSDALTTLFISFPVSWLLTTLTHVITFCVVFPRVKRRLLAAADEQSAETPPAV